MNLGLGSRVLRVAIAVVTTVLITIVACTAPVTPPPAGQGPQFLINSPLEDSFTAGTFFFSAQPLDPSDVQKVDFEVDGVSVGTDTTPADGFRVAIAASDYAAGPLVLEAVVTGMNGRTRTQSITVENVPNPPSNDPSVGSDGAVLGTATGSTLVIRSGDAVGANVTFTEQDQADVKAATGIDYAALGVTFLGAQEIDSDTVIEEPVMVSSADFASFVQPGEAIVNYMIAPDLDGDGIGELVVVNTASMAGDDVISDPVPQLQLGAITVTSQAGTTSLGTQQQSFTGGPGDFVEIEATGFNTVSLRSNRVVWTANGTIVEGTALASASADGSSQVLAFIVPVLPAGPATVELSNVSTGSAVSLNATIEPVAASTLLAVELAGSTEGIIDGFMQDSIAFIQGLPTDALGSADIKSMAVQQFVGVRMDLMIVFSYLEANSVPELEAILDGIAVQIQNSPDFFASGSGFSSQELSPAQKKNIKKITIFFGSTGVILELYGKFGKFGGAGVCTLLPQVCYVALGLEAGSALLKWYEFHEDERPGCEPIHTEVIESLKRLTGMGSAPPSGGPGCGNAPSGVFPAGTFFTSQQEAPDPIIVTVFVGGTPLPFKGVTDAGGYFFIPIMPDGEDFTALAFDTGSGEVRSFEGVGPPLGESVYMFFDFNSDDNAIPTFPLDSNVSADLALDETDLYVFVGTAGQLITVGAQGEPDFVSNYDVNLFSPTSANPLFSIGNGRFYTESSVVALPDPGIYTLSVVSDFGGGSGSGTYSVGLSEIEQPTPIDISISPKTVEGEQTIYGDRHFFSFDAQAGDILKFSLSLPPGSQFNAKLNLRGPGPEPFYERDDLFFPGSGGVVSGLDSLAVSNPFMVTETGEYIVEIERGNSSSTIEVSLGEWEFSVLTPDPPTAVTIGDTVPGNIGPPGEIDLFTFTATAGQQVDFSTDNFDMTVQQVNWSVTAPDGTEIFDEPLFMDPGTFTLVDGGIYTVLVGSDQDDGTGAYEFTLVNVP